MQGNEDKALNGDVTSSEGAARDSAAPGPRPDDAETSTDAFTTLIAAPDDHADDTDDTAEDAEDDKASTARVAGWGRVFRGNRTLWVVAIVAILSLVAGLAVQRFIISPAEAAAKADAAPPGLVTAPVEFRELNNDVTIRADVGYADATKVTIDTTSLQGAAVVTGKVPKVGDKLDKLSIAMEIGGRPVIVLPGELPSYRTLRIGVSGPDVKQLKQALTQVGIDPGDVDSDVFDQTLADAVARMYSDAGYSVPAGEEGSQDTYRTAQDGVSTAEESVATAESALNKAAAGPTEVEQLEANNAVNNAQAALDAAKADPSQAGQVGELQGALDVAVAQRNAAFAEKDVSAERAAVDSAYKTLERAKEDLEEARQAVQASLPASEVLFLTQLPRRVDEVTAKRGAVVTDSVMTVSGATVRLTGGVAEADAKLLAKDDKASFELPDGKSVEAKVTKITAGEAGKRWSVVLEPAELTADQISAVQGENVRVKIPIGATDGEVLAVPLAALTAGPDGGSRVEVVDSDPRDGSEAKTHLVTVETGLSAGGFVEVKPKKGDLKKGALVVIGK